MVNKEKCAEEGPIDFDLTELYFKEKYNDEGNSSNIVKYKIKT